MFAIEIVLRTDTSGKVEQLEPAVLEPVDELSVARADCRDESGDWLENLDKVQQFKVYYVRFASCAMVYGCVPTRHAL